MTRSAIERTAFVLYIAVLTVMEGVLDPQGSIVGQALRLAGWLAVLPGLYLVLDAMPLRRGVFLRNLSVHVVVAVVAGALQGLLTGVLAGLASQLRLPVAGNMVGSDALMVEISRGAGQSWVFLLAPHLVSAMLRARRQQEMEAKLSLARAQFHALSVELQPHFLFNTLNAIAGLVRTDARTAESMLIKLSDLLRLTLENGARGECSLGEELERLNLYVALQQMRFGPRLTVTTSVADDIMGAGVPSMLLQPLVENALSHGIGPKVGPGAIAITGRRVGDRLVLSVEDDGVGFAKDARGRERIGVGNTRARLAQLFPGDHAFDLSARPAGGVCALIDIPFREADHARADR